MTKKNYDKAVIIVGRRAYESTAHASQAVGVFVELFRDDNPRFNESRFQAACTKAILAARELRTQDKQKKIA